MKRILLLFITLCFSFSGFTQEVQVSEYMLFTGKAYVNYPLVQGGSATFKNYGFDSDTELIYHDQHFESKMLMYDLVLDELIIFHPDKEIPLILPRQWIDRFVIKQDTFVNLAQEDWLGLPNDGFYHQYYSSDSILCLVSYSKELRDVGHDISRSRQFLQHTRYFVRLNDTAPFQEISTHRQLLRLDPRRRRANRRLLFSLGLQSRDRLGEAIPVILYQMGQ